MHAADRERGFTLLELLVVMAIVGILATFGILGYFKYVDQARLTISVSVLENVRTMMVAYQVNHGGFPDDVNLEDCTDSEGEVVFDIVTCDNMKKNISSFESYESNSADEFVLKVKAKDSGRTIVTVTEKTLFY